ncbi:uncharacterized protein RJT20DRAFT_33990 [Scheffersomyces xylosifermentans]|uniref:uncharacterized protein n=1 Tax=Scheffersomyces xylosifermentans TaxID=1304137 RepID=UPI00315D88A2
MSSMNESANIAPLGLDRERVTCLLLINTHLMKKAINIYLTVLCNPQAQQQMPPQARQSAIESYQNCTRRLHCNLSVLNYIHEKYHSDPSQEPSHNKASFPIMLSPPQEMPELIQLYTKLQELYPEALQFLKSKLQQMKKQQQFQQSGQAPPQNQPPQLQQQQPPQQHSSIMQGQQIIPPRQQQQMPQRQINLQQNQIMSNNSPMLNNANPNSMNGPSGSGNQQEFLQQQFQGGYNGQGQKYNGNMNSVQPQLQQQSSALSPQQILQQVGTPGNANANLGNNNGNGMMDFF